MNQAQHQMMQIVQKIPVFDGLSLAQAQLLIQISQFKQFEAGDTVYDIGAVSDQMLVLVKGKLSVMSASGQPLGEILPGTSTGEMGVFTGHTRSATIVASEASAGLVLTSALLKDTMNGDREMKAIVLENVVTELSDRLAEMNTRLDVLRAQQEEASAEPVGEEPEEADEEGEVAAEPEGDETDGEEAVDSMEDDDEMPEAEDLA